MKLERLPVQVRLNSGTTLTGHIHIAGGSTILEFLSAKSHFLNLTDVRSEIAGSPAQLHHLGVRLAEVSWIQPLDEALHLTSASLPTDEAREVELHVAGGVVLHVLLHIAPETRLSDYLDSTTSFIPLTAARVVHTGDVMDRVALNHAAVLTVRELGPTDPGPRENDG